MRRDRELAPPRRSGMATHGARAALAIEKILPPESPNAGTRAIFNANIGVEKNPRAIGTQAAIQLGVFVMAEAFVIAADSQKLPQAESRVMTVIDEAADPPTAMGGAARSDAAVADPGHG